MKKELSLQLVGMALLFTFACVALLAGHGAAAQEVPRQRVLVLTDIGGDPDDEQSLIRFLLYANEFDIEGIMVTANRGHTKPELVYERIEAYRQVRPNLTVHAPDYPTADELLSKVKIGTSYRGIQSIGADQDTPASQYIIDVIDESDPRPLWILVWGAPTDLAQALWQIQRHRPIDEIEPMISKIRVYDIAGQDETGAWICHHFPGILWLRSTIQFQAISVREARPFPPEYTGANIDTFTPEWVDEHIQSHGPMGALYPERKYKYEGDTPAFLYLLPNGLSDPEWVHYGGWGGRFAAAPTQNVRGFRQRDTEGQKPFHDFWMHTEAADTWRYQDLVYQDSVFAALFRWREAFQNDFAARMDWSTTGSYFEANHNPVAAFGADDSRGIVNLHVQSSERVTLDGRRSHDPDGDGLTYRWFIYPEPGTYSGEVALQNARQPQAEITMPEVQTPQSLHVILEVKDNGTPPLFSYKRVVCHIAPAQ